MLLEHLGGLEARRPEAAGSLARPDELHRKRVEVPGLFRHGVGEWLAPRDGGLQGARGARRIGAAGRHSAQRVVDRA